MWALRYYWHLRENTDKPHRVGGTMLHTVYEYHYARRMEAPPAWFYEKSLEDKLSEQAAILPEPHRSRMLGMVKENYAEFLQYYGAAGERDPVQRVIAIEQEFVARIGDIDPGGPNSALDNEVVSCRPDLVYENHAGEWILDYKSHGRSRVNPRTGRLTRWQEDGEYGINFQSLVNLHVVRAHRGPKVRGFVVRRTTRQPPYDFDDHTVRIPAVAYQEAPWLMRALVQREVDLAAKIADGVPPLPAYFACYGRFGPCDYYEACMSPTKERMREVLLANFSQPSAEFLAAQRARLNIVK